MVPGSGVHAGFWRLSYHCIHGIGPALSKFCLSFTLLIKPVEWVTCLPSYRFNTKLMPLVAHFNSFIFKTTGSRCQCLFCSHEVLFQTCRQSMLLQEFLSLLPESFIHEYQRASSGSLQALASLQAAISGIHVIVAAPGPNP